MICVFLLKAGVLNDQVIQDYGWPQVVSAACLVLIWRNASDAEQASLRRLVAPLGGLGPDADRRGRGTLFGSALCVMARGRHGVATVDAQ